MIIERRRRWLSAEQVDQWVAAVLALDLVLETLSTRGGEPSGRIATLAIAVPFAACIAVRRRRPAGALIVCTVLALVQQVLRGYLFTRLPSESAELAPILCAYGAGAWLEFRRAAVTAAVAAALLAVVAFAADLQHVRGAPGAGGVAIVTFLVLGPWLVGCAVRERERRAAVFAELETRAIAERTERERAAILQEQILIGRELQDIIAHNVSVMVIQAGGARRLLARDRSRARESILNVERIGREALVEMRRLLGLLQREDDPRALAPQPGLEQLRDLAAALGEAGRSVTLREEGDRRDLSPGINLVGYRVAETVLRQASTPGPARATVRYRPRTLELELCGAALPSEIEPALDEVAERVRLYGGRLEMFPAPGHSFGVRCTLPLGVAAT